MPKRPASSSRNKQSTTTASSSNSLRSRQKYPPDISENPVKYGISPKFKFKPRNFSQELYSESLRTNPITIGSGPAGSGKTFVVSAIAIEKLIAGDIDKLILTRPVVEADEELGFLPGDLKDKLYPYLLPLYDAIDEQIGSQMTKKLIELGKIEIAPLAFMRGRTFNNAFVILDEAQNTTKKQMKLFVTRLGYNTQFCINGDVTQCDITDKIKGDENGLEWIVRKLKGQVAWINVIDFSYRDIVRNPLIIDMLARLDCPDDRPVKSTERYNGSRFNDNRLNA